LSKTLSWLLANAC